MGQRAYGALLLRNDLRPPFGTAIEAWRAARARGDGAVEESLERTIEEEAEYCRLRAAVEFSRSEEASHPAARAAHLEMALLYRHRLVAARQHDADEIQDWEGEGGSVLDE